MKKSLLLLLMIAFSGTMGSCNFETATYQQELIETLSSEYEAEEIHTKVQNQELIVTFVNSPLEELSAEEKQEIAQEIGALALSPENKPEFTAGKLVFEDNTDLGVLYRSESHSFDMQLEIQ